MEGEVLHVNGKNSKRSGCPGKQRRAPGCSHPHPMTVVSPGQVGAERAAEGHVPVQKQMSAFVSLRLLDF